MVAAHAFACQVRSLVIPERGDDSDTIAAVYGQLAGAHYGERGIPERWRERLAKRELIESFADRLARA
jgi:ADP-ribosylglycohydrolase